MTFILVRFRIKEVSNVVGSNGKFDVFIAEFIPVIIDKLKAGKLDATYPIIYTLDVVALTHLLLAVENVGIEHKESYSTPVEYLIDSLALSLCYHKGPIDDSTIRNYYGDELTPSPVLARCLKYSLRMFDEQRTHTTEIEQKLNAIRDSQCLVTKEYLTKNIVVTHSNDSTAHIVELCKPEYGIVELRGGSMIKDLCVLSGCSYQKCTAVCEALKTSSYGKKALECLIEFMRSRYQRVSEDPC